MTQRRRALKDGEIRCTICHFTAIMPTDGERRVCGDCQRELHRWNRKLYSSTPVIKGREYISRKR